MRGWGCGGSGSTSITTGAFFFRAVIALAVTGSPDSVILSSTSTRFSSGTFASARACETLEIRVCDVDIFAVTSAASILFSNLTVVKLLAK